MTWKALLVVYLFAVVARIVNGCCGSCGGCGGYKFLQLRRPEYLPMYESPPPCEPIYDDQDSFYDNELMPMYPEPVTKYDDALDRYLASYFEPKPIRTKGYCNKAHSPTSRLMSNSPKYYKRGFGNEAFVEGIPMRTSLPCGQFGCGNHEGCRPFSSCEMSPHVFRHSPQRVLPPLTLPPSCIC